MVTLHLLGPGLPSSGNELHYLLDLESLHREKKIRFSSSRPALLPYRDPLVSLASRLLFLGYHLLVPESQALTVRIPMGEQVELATQYSEMPVLAYLEINAGQILQTYDASIVMTAQLRGLRWLMYQYRLPVFILATLLFWAAEMLFMIAAWATWSARASASSGTQTRGSASPETAAAVKRDEAGLDEFSSTATTTLPAYSIRENPEHELHNREWAPDNEQDHASPARPGGGVDELESDVRWVRDDIGVGKGASDMGSVRRRSSHRRLT
ncbi:hypothetical protein SODALDRAFT_36941 [Sodiomyces alkalinus F11]|uniref:Seipin n=1 Tax=Sodiomyces alkalinus (strain CBS 110278 / VKM F-3762 / F11) TaxID=1314773 RepID=A0A3N2Q9D3_SODAK|nr:hypothetical protein SODALDRAFT_36941 [Sodiomyces alkalinus F11]ROT43346.1 hypothetical protein SODALDRAFT_36941 [Sodiomyces alkalinus F11]